MVAFTTIISILFCMPLIYFSLKFAKTSGGQGLSAPKFQYTLIIISVMFFAALLLRLVLAFSVEGYSTDIGTFKSWGSLTNSAGYQNVYSEASFLDYPPGYLYVLSFLDHVRSFFGLEFVDSMYTMILKTPSILADLASAFIVYKMAAKRWGENFGIFTSAAYLFCPAVILNSAIWGQIDSFCTLLVLFSLHFLKKDKYLFAGLIYGLCSLCKPQMLMFAPIFLFYTIYKKAYKGLIIGLASCFFIIILLSTPFINNFNYFWLVEKYAATMASYPYMSVNAYNFWALLTLNWVPLPQNEIFTFVLNWSAPVLVCILSGIFMFKCKSKIRIYATAAIITSTMYIFAIKMHERYFFPTLLFLLIIYVLTKDRRFIYCFSLFTIVHTINVFYVMITPGYFPPGNSWYILILSAIFFFTYLYMMYLFYLYMKLPKDVEGINVPKPLYKIKHDLKVGFYKEEKVQRFSKKLNKRDVIVVLLITSFYSIFAFWNLGDTSTANTSWLPTSGDEVVVKTNGEYTHINYLIGIAKGENSSSRVASNITIYASDDGENFTEIKSLSNQSFSFVYQWQSFDVIDSPQYIKLVANDDISVLNEIAFVNQTTGQKLESTLVSGGGELLLDEWSSVPVYPGYKNSTYFDEIYHARTAYEYLNGIEPYENTHPPLGKLIISFFITIFGMNPFGWRFAGALFGVLMLPVLYFILRRFFKSSVLCGAGIFLFAFDFMHFTQTRIATIDTYSVFFILLMYAAMIVFCQKDIINSSLKSLMLPLLLSGIFMGLGIASKWTCAYAAIGLAVMFFTKIISSLLDARKDEENLKLIKNKSMLTCLFCVAFFIIIPFGIYFVSFLPMYLIDYNSSDIFGVFIRSQTHMFNYHSGLVSNHPFASPYYEWPLNIRSIWYFVSYNFEGTGLYSSISALGNPAVWWSGFIALAYAIFRKVVRKSEVLNFIVIGFLAVYLPWVLIPRETFVYHYFTAVPFIVTAIIYAFSKMQEKKQFTLNLSSKTLSIDLSHIGLIFLCAVSFMLFLGFYPVISGAPVSQEYANGLEWLTTWNFL